MSDNVDNNGFDQQSKVALNLDDLEREGGSPQPFDFQLAGKRFILSDPQEIDWQDLMSAMSNPTMFFRMVLPADSHAEFFATKIPSWKMNQLMGAYQRHYKLPTQGPGGDMTARF
jgi:hypothetical protein